MVVAGHGHFHISLRHLGPDGLRAGAGAQTTKAQQGRRYTTLTLGSFQYMAGCDGFRAVTQRMGDFRFATVTPRYRPLGQSRRKEGVEEAPTEGVATPHPAEG